MLCLDEDLLTRYAGYEKTSQLFAALSDKLSSVLQAHYTGIQSWVVMNFPETGDLVDYVWDYRVSEYADKTCPFIKLEYDLGSLVVYPVFREFGLEDLLIKDEREGFYMGDFDDMGAEI